MAATLVLAILAACLASALGLTLFGLAQLGSGRRRPAGAGSVAKAPAPSSAPATAAPALVLFEDQAPLQAEPGVLLNTLWEHLTTAECQQGECGGCRLRLLEGQVRWIREPQAEVDRRTHILACSCEPIGSVRCARP